MGMIKRKDTKIEIEFRKLLWSKGLRYKKNPKGYFGKPDIVLKRYKVVIFLDSCFWHGCKKHGHLPKSNVVYWQKNRAQQTKRQESYSPLQTKRMEID